jgi:hypothetical protein
MDGGTAVTDTMRAVRAVLVRVARLTRDAEEQQWELAARLYGRRSQ